MHLLFLLISAFACFLFVAGVYVLAVAIYNLTYHPYARYPGPIWARAFPLYALLHAHRGDLHLDVARCHEKYGQYPYKKLVR